MNVTKEKERYFFRKKRYLEEWVVTINENLKPILREKRVHVSVYILKAWMHTKASVTALGIPFLKIQNNCPKTIVRKFMVSKLVKEKKKEIITLCNRSIQELDERITENTKSILREVRGHVSDKVLKAWMHTEVSLTALRIRL